MKVKLRPHHLLCLKGYKGYNYNNSHKASWEFVHHKLLLESDADVLIINGQDDLCAECPNKVLTQKSHCIDTNVKKLDEAIKSLIQITTDNTYKYSELAEKLKTKVTRQIHEQLCSGCAWWKKGLCRNSFEK